MTGILISWVICWRKSQEFMSDICSSISITSKQPFASLKRVNAKEALEHVVTATNKHKNT